MRNRSHPLRIWLLQNDLSLAKFATRVGISAHHLYEAINRDTTISYALAEYINQVTKGAIVAADFDVGLGDHGKRNRPSLTPAEVRGIRKAREKGIKLQVLSARYGVSMAAISRIANGKTHIT